MNQSPWQAFEAFPTLLHQRLAPLDPAVVRFKPAPAEWSIAEIVGHYGDIEAIWTARIERMLAEETPRFPPFSPDALVAEQAFQGRPLEELLARFAERRSAQALTLSSLQPDQLERGAIHPTRGYVSIGEVPAVLAGHDRLHMAQIEANIVTYQGSV